MRSVPRALSELARSATRRIPGIRMCVDGREDGAITHLVIGAERRTLKLMLAVANGAFLLTPEWLTASIEANTWLPEASYTAKVNHCGLQQ